MENKQELSSKAILERYSFLCKKIGELVVCDDRISDELWKEYYELQHEILERMEITAGEYYYRQGTTGGSNPFRHIKPNVKKVKYKSSMDRLGVEPYELLEEYSSWLEKKGYMDCDWYCEEPKTVEAFLNYKNKK